MVATANSIWKSRCAYWFIDDEDVGDDSACSGEGVILKEAMSGKYQYFLVSVTYRVSPAIMICSCAVMLVPVVAD